MVERGIQKARAAIESTYLGKCTIYEYKTITDKETGISSKREISVLEDQPCRLSYQKIMTTESVEGAHVPVQTVKLFLAPEIKICAGSKIVVTQNEITKEYERSGEAAVYATHQEISLELFKKYA